MRIGVWDDQMEESEKLETLVVAYLSKRGIIGEVSIIKTLTEIKDNLLDVLILDIEMPELSGIEVKDRLSVGEKPLIIFATNYGEFMPEAFGKNVLGYLIKPVDLPSLGRVMDCALNLIKVEYLFQFDDASMISSKDVVLIRMDKGYLDLILYDDSQRSWVKKTMKEAESLLGPYGFLRIADGCLVNGLHVDRFEGNSVILKGSCGRVTISRRRKKVCIEKYREYCFRMAKFSV